MGHSKKRSILLPMSRERICLKNVLNFYKMSREGDGVLLISSVGGMDIFWNDPININLTWIVSYKIHKIS